MLGRFFSRPEASDQERVPPGQYLAKGFPVLTYGTTPELAPGEWRLKLWGTTPERFFGWDELMALPQQDFTADFHCVTRWSKLDVQWRGVKMADLLAQIELSPSTTHVLQHCTGGYTTNVTLADLARAENFLAHTLNGQPLPPDHGGPVRTIIPHLYAWKSAKWISGLEFLDHEELGFWERNGYHRRGEPWAEERYGG